VENCQKRKKKKEKYYEKLTQEELREIESVVEEYFEI